MLSSKTLAASALMSAMSAEAFLAPAMPSRFVLIPHSTSSTTQSSDKLYSSF